MKTNIKKLIQKYQIHLSKKLGQNFLIDKKIINKIIKESNLQKDDVVLEIGPGVGNITKEIAKRVKKVIAVEKDHKIIKPLNETLKDFNNVKIIEEDILKFEISETKANKVIANLPFYITSPLIKKLIITKKQPEKIVLLVQKEIAQRICSKPPKANILSVFVLLYSNPKIIKYVSRKSFWPTPNVDSAIIRITPLKKKINVCDFNNISKIIKFGFSHPRKQIAVNFSNKFKINKKDIVYWLSKNGINSEQRAGTLTIKNWKDLARNINILS